MAISRSFRVGMNEIVSMTWSSSWVCWVGMLERSCESTSLVWFLCSSVTAEFGFALSINKCPNKVICFVYCIVFAICALKIIITFRATSCWLGGTFWCLSLHRGSSTIVHKQTKLSLTNGSELSKLLYRHAITYSSVHVFAECGCKGTRLLQVVSHNCVSFEKSMSCTQETAIWFVDACDMLFASIFLIHICGVSTGQSIYNTKIDTHRK